MRREASRYCERSEAIQKIRSHSCIRGKKNRKE